MEKDCYAMILCGTLSGLLLSMAIFLDKTPSLLRVFEGATASLMLMISIVFAIDYAVAKIKEK